jgi:hypothetical protein
VSLLYGSDERPETEIMLDPGEPVRILGSGLMPLHSNMDCQSKDTAMFHADFQVYHDDIAAQTAN